MKTTSLFTKTLPIIVLLCLLVSALPAAAATFSVTNANDSGPGSLRDAINQANSNAQEDTINFDPTFFNTQRTITLTSGEILITPDDQNGNGLTGRLVTINGPGANLLTISGGNASRIFLLAGNPGREQQNANVTMSGMTLRDGNGVGAINGDGGAIYAQVAANLTLNSMVIRNNVITAVATGGGMSLNTVRSVVINDSLITENSAYNAGGFVVDNIQELRFTMRDTIVSNNTAASGNVGGVNVIRGTNVITNCQIVGNSARGAIGGINFFQALLIDMSDTTISSNMAGAGVNGAGSVGGISTDGAAVATFRRVTISNNSVKGDTGGMNIRNPGGIVTIIDSTVSNNTSSQIQFVGDTRGGGISILGEEQSGHAERIINTTISGNSASNQGGGIYNFSHGLELINSTVVNNSISNSRSNGQEGGGGIFDGEQARSGTFGFRVKLQNSIIAGNTAAVAGNTAANGPDLYSGFDSAGYNIIGNTSGTNNSAAAAGDQFNVDPQVGPLADNGGGTLTHALLQGSPAIDQGKSADVPTDQRGFARPFEFPSVANAQGGDGSDIGAIESGAASQPLNISTRLRVLPGENALIGGFIITGSAPKRVLIRAIGPSLESQGVEGALPDTTLELFAGDGTSLALNDNWRDTQESEIAETTIPPTNDLESAIVAMLEPGGYTAIVRGKGGAVGIALIEAYDLARGVQSKLANISSRGFVDQGDSVIIGGFIVGGDNTKVILRAIGPSLGGAGVSDPLQDPTLQLVDGNGTLVRENDNWRSDQEAEIQASGIPPMNDLESALVATLARGNYTAVVRGQNNTTGVGLVEIYNVQ